MFRRRSWVTKRNFRQKTKGHIFIFLQVQAVVALRRCVCVEEGSFKSSYFSDINKIVIGGTITVMLRGVSLLSTVTKINESIYVIILLHISFAVSVAIQSATVRNFINTKWIILSIFKGMGTVDTWTSFCVTGKNNFYRESARKQRSLGALNRRNREQRDWICMMESVHLNLDTNIPGFRTLQGMEVKSSYLYGFIGEHITLMFPEDWGSIYK